MMQWDDRKGKYIKPFSSPKKIELIKNLYIEGNKIYWEIPKPNNPKNDKERKMLSDFILNKGVTQEQIQPILKKGEKYAG